MIKTLKNSRGFTLAELTVVILIVGILSTSAAPNLVDLTTGARFVGTKATVESIREVLLLYFMEHGTYPTNDQVFFGEGATEGNGGGGGGVTPNDPAWDYFVKPPVNLIVNEPDFIYIASLAEAQAIVTMWSGNFADFPIGFWYIGNSSDPNFGMVGAFGLTEGCSPLAPGWDPLAGLRQALNCGT